MRVSGSTRQRRSSAHFVALLGVLACTGPMPSCVRVTASYRDVGADSPRLDAALGMDAGSMCAPATMEGADATRAVLASIGERVVLASLREFDDTTTELVLSTDAWRTSLAPADRDRARSAWRASMQTWQRVEALQVGPAGLGDVTAAGRGLRDEIDSWPLTNRCRIDQETVEVVHADPALFALESVNVRGLDAMEYLLFFEPIENGCPVTATINRSGSWAALGPAEIEQRRATYAHTLAVLVRDRSTELRRAWEPSDGNYLGALATAGAGSTTFPTAQAGLNAVSDALFYLDKEVADFKLGIPAGLRLECATDTCPERVESPWAGASLDHIRINVEAFHDAYLGAPAGTDAPGFDDLLRSIGAGELDARIAVAMAAVLAAIDAVDGTLEAAIVGDHAAVVALHDAVRALTRLFDVELVCVLDLDLPTRLEGDND